MTGIGCQNHWNKICLFSMTAKLKYVKEIVHAENARNDAVLELF